MSNNLIGMSYRDRPEDMADISQEEFKRRRRAQNLAADYVKKYQTGEAAAEAMDKEIYSVDNLDDFDLRSGGAGSALAKPGADGKGYEPGDGTQTIGTRQYGAGEARYSIDDARSLWKEGKFTLGELQAYGEGLEEGAIYGAGTQRYLDNQIAKYGTDAYYGDTLPDPDLGEVVDLPPEVVDPPPEVVINNPPPPAGWVDPPRGTITPPPSEIIETPNAEVIQVIDDGGSGPGSSNNSNVSIITDIDQINEQESTAGNYFGNIDNVGNGNNISGGSFVIDNRQEGGDNTSINNSTQSAVVTPTVTVKQQNTTYNPYTGAAEIDLFKPGSYEIDYSQILDKFKTQPFFII